MPCIGYAMTYPNDPPETPERLGLLCRKVYDDLRISLTGAVWDGLRKDRVVNMHKRARRFRSRPNGLRISTEAKMGDVVILPEYTRGFRAIGDFLSVCRRLMGAGVRVIVIDIGFDSATAIGSGLVGIMSAAGKQMAKQNEIDAAARPKKDALPGTATNGRPLLGLENKGPRSNRRVYVCPETYELGVKVREWKASGWSMPQIAKHLFEQKVFRTVEAGAARSSLAWSAGALRKLAGNLSTIDDLALNGDVRLPATWRPATGPLSLVPVEEKIKGRGIGQQVEPSHWMRAKQIGEKLREVRKAKGWTQYQLADAAGMPQSHVSDIEKGKGLPTTRTLRRLAAAVGASLEIFRLVPVREVGLPVILDEVDPAPVTEEMIARTSPLQPS